LSAARKPRIESRRFREDGNAEVCGCDCAGACGVDAGRLQHSQGRWPGHRISRPRPATTRSTTRRKEGAAAAGPLLLAAGRLDRAARIGDAQVVLHVADARDVLDAVLGLALLFAARDRAVERDLAVFRR
jgi:hypothetical protein